MHIGNHKYKIAKGRVFPRDKGDILAITTGHMKVIIDHVEEAGSRLPIPVPQEGIEDMTTAIGSLIQWPKNEIVLDEVNFVCTSY